MLRSEDGDSQDLNMWRWRMEALVAGATAKGEYTYQASGVLSVD